MMIHAVIFDMYETLITQYNNPVYFGTQMAKDANIPEEQFQKLWRPTESERTIGKITLEATLEMILRQNQCYSKQLLDTLVHKRIETKRENFLHLHSEIVPMLQKLKNNGIKVGLISNCFSEEVIAIRESILFPYFDSVCLSYELGIQKPEVEIFRRCMDELSVSTEECLYVGDGGSYELETARTLGMNVVQAVWYLKEGTSQPSERKREFEQMENPMKVISYLSE